MRDVLRAVFQALPGVTMQTTDPFSAERLGYQSAQGPGNRTEETGGRKNVWPRYSTGPVGLDSAG
jgi:hypothetical protein